ncbi:T9SS type A sorting domain-containing protein [Pedobacter aquae]|uniref:T9SS type A sorting domain-containing protein n=1 Tax=Pedobacter aquae TaxID=2605747 RepID=A0A5C0VCY5_9SPHI|nr:T9SS type A sorting domain-containing protein [Pedobacter aquae]QEK50246.1 T9SS type A sorting domain-containing protein [Pedobacter aquae]
MKKILLFLLGLSNSVLAQTTIFSQDFSSSAVVADYVSATPNSGQFNAIGAPSGANNNINITNSKLNFTRGSASGGGGTFSRTTDFSPVPSIIIYKFDLEVTNNLLGITTAAVFQVGSGFGTANGAEANASVHSRIGIGITDTPGEFRVRNIGDLVNGSVIHTGSKTITWVVNNSSSTYTYVAPNGSSETVAPDTWDLFVGTLKEFNDNSAQTASQVLSDLKFSFVDGLATISLDNISIESVTPLPIQLSSFTAQAIDKTILLNWETLSETNNAFFEIERSIDGKTFTKIGSKDGSGTTTALTKYRFVDENPVPGTNYYRLKQIDFDGKSETSAVKSAISNIPFATLSILQGSNLVTAQVLSPVKEKAKLSLFDVGGKVLAQQEILIEKGLNQFEFNQNLVSGVYFFKLTSASSHINTKFVKP